MNPIGILIEALAEILATYVVPYPPPLTPQLHRKFAELDSEHRKLLFEAAEAKAKMHFSYDYRRKYYDLIKEISSLQMKMTLHEIELWIDDYSIWMNKNSIYR